ncbi:MAG: hypothetical protein AB7F88_13295 [Pyrinomonadaceae bacterium]
MSTVVDAVFDGTVVRPGGKVPLKPNTRVQVPVEVDETQRDNGDPSS